MAISEFEIKRCEKYVSEYIEKNRPPAHVRNEVDLCYRIEDQSVIIYEIRAAWKAPKEKIEEMVAKTTYVKKDKVWKVFWHRADMKWHGYEPMPKVKTLEDFLSLVEEDQHCCFYG